VAALIATTSPDAAGVRRVVQTFGVDDADAMRVAAQAASEMSGVVFIGTLEGGTALAVGAHPDAGYDAGARVKGALAAVGGRGGGSPRVAQGTVTEPAQMAAVVAALMG
jgi:alanyl-tRNA synthetase